MPLFQPKTDPTFVAVGADDSSRKSQTIFTLIPTENEGQIELPPSSYNILPPLAAVGTATARRLRRWFSSSMDFSRHKSMPPSSTKSFPRYRGSHTIGSINTQPYKVGSTVEQRYSNDDQSERYFTHDLVRNNETLLFSTSSKKSSITASYADEADGQRFSRNNADTIRRNDKASKQRNKCNAYRHKISSNAIKFQKLLSRSHCRSDSIDSSFNDLHTGSKRSQQSLEVNPNTLLISNHSYSNNKESHLQQQQQKQRRQHTDHQRQKRAWSPKQIGSATSKSAHSTVMCNPKSSKEIYTTHSGEASIAHSQETGFSSSATQSSASLFMDNITDQATDTTTAICSITIIEIRNSKSFSKRHPYFFDHVLDPLHGSSQAAGQRAVAGCSRSQTLNPKQVTTLEIIEFKSANVSASWRSQICTQIKLESSDGVKRINSLEPVIFSESIKPPITSAPSLISKPEIDLQYAWHYHSLQSYSVDKSFVMWPKQSSRFKLLKSHQAAAGSSSSPHSSTFPTSASFELHDSSSGSQSSIQTSKSVGSSPFLRSHKSFSFFQKGRSLSDSSSSSISSSSKPDNVKVPPKSSSRSLSVSHRSHPEKADPAHLERYLMDNPYEHEDNRHQHHSSLDSILPPPPRHDQHFISKSDMLRLHQESSVSDKRSHKVTPVSTMVSSDPPRHRLPSQRSCHNLRSVTKAEAPGFEHHSALGMWGSTENAFQPARNHIECQLDSFTPPFNHGNFEDDNLILPPRADASAGFPSEKNFASEPETPRDQFLFEMSTSTYPVTSYQHVSANNSVSSTGCQQFAPKASSDFCFSESYQNSENNYKARLRSYYDWEDIDANINKIQASFQCWDQEYLRQEIEEMLEVPQPFMIKRTVSRVGSNNSFVF